MSTENALQELLNDAAKKLANKNKVKPQPLNGQYRNRMWYRHVLKDKTFDEAIDVISANLKHKSFAFEEECAKDVFFEKYNMQFQTRAEFTKQALENENAELKRKLAELEAAKISNIVKDDGKTTIDFSEFPPNMTKDEFKTFFFEWFEKSQGKKPAPVIFGKAWKNYSGENEVEKV